MMTADSCENTSIEVLKAYPDVPESKPSETSVNEFTEVIQTPGETADNIAILAENIRAALADRELPIRIRRGETIINIDGFAKAHARSIVTGSPNLADLARGRLELLGIELPTNNTGGLS